MSLSLYITDQQVDWLLEELNIADCSIQRKQDLVARAVASMEAQLSKKFIVPLVSARTNFYSDAPKFATVKIQSMLKCKLRSILGLDKNRNLVSSESSGKFINLHEEEFQRELNELLDQEIDYGFKLQPQASGAREAVSHLGLARGSSSYET